MNTGEGRKGMERRLAVALYYDGVKAPTVSAKGWGLVGERIIARARELGIPVREDRFLCAALAQVPLDEEIPEELYLAVAQVLAFVYRLSAQTIPEQDGRQ